MAFTKEMLDQILKEYKGPDDMFGQEGILKQLNKALIERAMEAELTGQLGYEKSDQGEKETANRRNGKTTKTLRTDQGPMEIDVPRDRAGAFEPQIIKKHQREWKGFDDKILSMYAFGMSTRDIQAHLKEIYAVDVSAELISRVTDEVKDLLTAWRSRPLDPFYPVVFLDALRLNIREDSQVVKKAVYLALAIRINGQKELLGMWIAENEGSKFWLGVMNELKNRGVRDILIAAVDGLTGFPDAINTAFPRTEVQLCMVHMVRNSCKYVSWKDRKAVASGLKTIYTAPSEELAAGALEDFARVWDAKYPAISRSWKSRWMEVIPFFKFPPEIRKVVYTTNAIESVNYTIRKAVNNRQSFPNDDAALKLIFMSLQRISKKWTMPLRDWGTALSQFAVIYGERFPL
jgi:transposase-like protein